MTLLAAACGGGGEPPSGTPAPPADAGAIRLLDLNQLSAVQTALRQLNASLDPREVIFADLTGDRRDEAVVPLSSGGTAGNLAYLVFTLKDDKPAVILDRRADRSTAGGLRMSIEQERLVETRGEYGLEDALCCPTRLRQTTLRWDGAALQVDGETVVERTPGPKQ